MERSDCQTLLDNAEALGDAGKNVRAMEEFTRAAECWQKWESFSRAALAYERAYEHAMLERRYCEAARLLLRAGYQWMRQAEYDKFELDCQIAADACLMAAERDRDPSMLVDATLYALLGGDRDMVKELLRAAQRTSDLADERVLRVAFLMSEFEFGVADDYIETVLTKVLDEERLADVREFFVLMFAGFVRASLESEVALTVSSIAESTGMKVSRARRIIRRSIERGLIPAYLDEENDELVVDSDRFDADLLALRQRPILSRDLEDPGAWDIPDRDSD